MKRYGEKMKKKFILSIFCCLTVLLVATGCGVQRPKLIDEESVVNYLKDTYPNETFEIISNKEIDITHSNCGDEKVVGTSWLVKSNNTGIEFNVKDSYDFNSFTCEYGIKNDYVTSALEEKSKLNTYNKLHISYNSIEVYEKEFSSKSEMVDTLYNAIAEMKSEAPFKYGANIYIHICLNDRENCKFLYFDNISSKEYINDIINKN